MRCDSSERSRIYLTRTTTRAGIERLARPQSAGFSSNSKVEAEGQANRRDAERQRNGIVRTGSHIIFEGVPPLLLLVAPIIVSVTIRTNRIGTRVPEYRLPESDRHIDASPCLRVSAVCFFLLALL